MGNLDFMRDRPTLADRSRERYATPKHEIGSNLVTKEERKQAKKENAETFRKKVWLRDESKCRATGVPLSKSGTDPHRVGEVDHAYQRSTHPDRIYDVSNGILISKFLNRFRKVVCRNAPEFHRFSYSGPDDRKEKQIFLWRDDDGKITKTRIG